MEEMQQDAVVFVNWTGPDETVVGKFTGVLA